MQYLFCVCKAIRYECMICYADNRYHVFSQSLNATQVGLGKNWRAFCPVWRPNKWWNYMCLHTRVRTHVYTYMWTHTCLCIHGGMLQSRLKCETRWDNMAPKCSKMEAQHTTQGTHTCIICHISCTIYHASYSRLKWETRWSNMAPQCSKMEAQHTTQGTHTCIIYHISYIIYHISYHVISYRIVSYHLRVPLSSFRSQI